MSEELKPCPFCGSGSLKIRYKITDRAFYIECQNCGGCGSIDGDLKEAIKAWNRRAQ